MTLKENYMLSIEKRLNATERGVLVIFIEACIDSSYDLMDKINEMTDGKKLFTKYRSALETIRNNIKNGSSIYVAAGWAQAYEGSLYMKTSAIVNKNKIDSKNANRFDQRSVYLKEFIKGQFNRLDSIEGAMRNELTGG